MSGSIQRLVEALCRVLGPGTRVIETHISVVILAGGYAYKLKKPVNLGFVDFSTLERRRFYCNEELRLNRRLAPQVYLDVVAITGSEDAPVLGGDGPPIEYAVRMREFPQDALAAAALERGAVTSEVVDELASIVADFHARAAAADPHDARARVDGILALALRNFERLDAFAIDVERAGELRAWTRAEHARLGELMKQRHARARVREGHGDLHLGNIALIDGRPVIFDCIEFDDALRFIDVMSEVAFVVMDLKAHGRADLAYRFLNAYLEITGDYEGLRVLPFYLAYRALVRAMVACERARQQAPGHAADEALAQARRYFDVAYRGVHAREGAVIVTHGFSGSGKTTGSQRVVEALPAIRIRTDAERKRLHGMRPTDREPATPGESLYSPEVTHWTYRHVLAQGRSAALAGIACIADGTFLRRWQRDMFRDLAHELAVPFVILSFKARAASMRARIDARRRAAGDASDADLDVLDLQLIAYDPLGAEEAACTVAVDTERPGDDPMPRLADEVARQRSRLAYAA